MARRLRKRLGALILISVLLMLSGSGIRAHAESLNAELALSAAPDPETGIFTVDFSVTSDAPAAFSGEVSVSGGNVLRLEAADCSVNGARFVYGAGTRSVLSGSVTISALAASDVQVTLSVSAASVVDFSTASCTATLTVPQDAFSAVVPAYPADGGSIVPSVPVPEETQARDYAAMDAEAARLIREAQARKAAQEAAANQADAAQYYAADQNRMAEERRKESEEARNAGHLAPKKPDEANSDGGEDRAEDEADNVDPSGTGNREDADNNADGSGMNGGTGKNGSAGSGISGDPKTGGDPGNTGENGSADKDGRDAAPDAAENGADAGADPDEAPEGASIADPDYMDGKTPDGKTPDGKDPKDPNGKLSNRPEKQLTASDIVLIALGALSVVTAAAAGTYGISKLVRQRKKNNL